MHFKAKDIINEKYTVIFPIKQEGASESYRVKDSSMNRYILKLIDKALTPQKRFSSDGNLKEIELLMEVDHPCLPKLVEHGQINVDGKNFVFLVTSFVNSETVAERLLRSSVINASDAKKIARALLQALKHLHDRPTPIIHNNVTAANVLIDLTNDNIDRVILTGFERACHQSEAMQQDFAEGDWFSLAPECLDGASTPQSDLYQVGAMMYQLLFGMLPWYCDLTSIAAERRKQFVLKQKQSELLIPMVSGNEIDHNLLNVIRKALAADIDERFDNAQEFIDAVNGVITVTPPAQSPDKSGATASNKISFVTSSGNGFDDVAGMNEIKQMLKHDVIDRLRDIDKAKRYKLTIPNGIMLYGPPGCGKSFIAEKFAEEAGYHFKLIKSSDLASVYIHGSQGRIAALFNDARTNAPTILCFDEFDALVPIRGSHGNEYQSGEVNEFLSQLNNCGEQGVFVIASTNRPDIIDPAVLRRGRIDKTIFIAPPDDEAKALIFEKHLQGRPYDDDINFARLARLARNYISSDIAYVVNEAASIAADRDTSISQEIIEEVLSRSKPSLSPDVIDDYMHMREKMENISKPRRRVGF